ncbi:unnamed protein product [Pieris brassicae]|uniref:Uncharacterized protein n=1 Tax=Pieris brassicae TaxID=7116 RepID=A0A9P0THI1_PIEBR|nr:unnamed protein product [Pieris brassicae]
MREAGGGPPSRPGAGCWPRGGCELTRRRRPAAPTSIAFARAARLAARAPAARRAAIDPRPTPTWLFPFL